MSTGDPRRAEPVAGDRRILLAFSTIAKLVRLRFDQRARAIGVTLAQWRVIAEVRRVEGATQRQIAEQLEVGDVTAGRLIDKVCERGWVERRPDPADRRAHRIYLTPKAAPLLMILDRLAAEEERCTLEGLDETELTQLTQLLDRISGNLNRPIETAAVA